MATASKTWTWNSDLESWSASADGDGNAQRDASNGDPNAGSLQMYLTAGRTQSGNGYFDLTTVSWATLFGISSSATVTDVQVLAGTRTYCGLTHWLGGQVFNGASATVYVNDGGDQSIWTRSMSTNDSGWNTGSAGTKRTLTTPITASTNADLRVTLYASTGNTANSTCSVHLDYLTIEITYSAGSTKNGTANVFATAVTADAARRIRARTGEAVAAVVASAGSTKPARSSPVVATVATAAGARLKQGTASIVCVASTGGGGGGGPLTVWSSTADGRCDCKSTVWATARSGGGTKTVYGGSFSMTGCDDLSASNYYCAEGFYDFDTSSIGAGATVTVATFSLYAYSGTTTEDIHLRAYDWGGTLTTDDWRNATEAAALDLVAEYTATWASGAYRSFTSETAFLSNISLTGTTYLFNHGEGLVTDTAPTDDVWASAYYADQTGTDNDPKLYVEWTAAGGGPTGFRIRQRTADAVAAVEATSTAARTRSRTGDVFAVAVSTATGLMLDAPATVTVSMSGEDRYVEWSAVTGATGYVVERSVDGGAWTQEYP